MVHTGLLVLLLAQKRHTAFLDLQLRALPGQSVSVKFKSRSQHSLLTTLSVINFTLGLSRTPSESDCYYHEQVLVVNKLSPHTTQLLSRSSVLQAH